MGHAPVVQRMRIARIIRRTRLQLSETQTAFGKRCGVTQSIVSEWEAGTRRPNKFALLQIAESATPNGRKTLLTDAQDARPQWARTKQQSCGAPDVSQTLPLQGGVTSPLNDSMGPGAEGVNVRLS